MSDADPSQPGLSSAHHLLLERGTILPDCRCREVGLHGRVLLRQKDRTRPDKTGQDRTRQTRQTRRTRRTRQDKTRTRQEKTKATSGQWWSFSLPERNWGQSFQTQISRVVEHVEFRGEFRPGNSDAEIDEQANSECVIYACPQGNSHQVQLPLEFAPRSRHLITTVDVFAIPSWNSLAPPSSCDYQGIRILKQGEFVHQKDNNRMTINSFFWGIRT
jgi:hypothetical protein